MEANPNNPQMTVGERSAKWRREHPAQFAGMVRMSPSRRRLHEKSVASMHRRNKARNAMLRKFRELYDAGLTPTLIARRMGVCCERSYQLHRELRLPYIKKKTVIERCLDES